MQRAADWLTLSEVSMNRNTLRGIALFTVACLVVALASIVIAQPAKDSKPAGMPEMKLPPGWTPADMQACMEAATPGKMHEHLAKNVGTWAGKNTMWMAPETEPMKSECVATYTPMLDGRFVKCEINGDMPGMGPFNGFGLYGFDNVSQKFQGTWVDNCGTGMMTGTGELSSDGKTLTWNYSYHCPIAKKAVAMREIETMTGPNSKTLEMYGTDPKSGKEFKMMVIEFTRKTGTAAVQPGTR
jgi:hypothetical protein